MLWLAALLFAFLYTHAAGADSASAHVAGGAVAVPRLASTDADDGHHHDSRTPDGRGDDHGHPAEECASGHPQQGCELPAPHMVPLGDQTPALAAMLPQPWTRTVPSGLPPLRSSLSSVVQQV
ncbi:hypothetical protein OG304_04490 [Streptomyces sp. NBC_00160]|uniref:hypothetical protein n=1 Tax=Streptomyces sp. NBC_00160 TaxID=2903628 RepID=UPI0022526C41|nr:hypothetical protein [Streptomyces sp. NBC_00160]MCX5302710.1 hypothetical protein [Streptomyces sp. NBC_00160]